MHLSVFAEISGSRVLAGAIDTLPGSGEQFTYSDEWVEGGKPPLSISLPTAEGAFPARRVRAYLKAFFPKAIRAR